tara:strand:+ start:4890 stop:6299 length:1410 start_codon:yes stop_codon:yes gene_type:complete
MTNFNKSAQGELQITENSPVAQIVPQYGVLTNATATEVNGGTAISIGSKFCCESGSNVGGLGLLTTKKHLFVKSGQGGSVILDAIYGIPQAGVIQVAGLISSENLAGFGYIGTDFGIIYGYGGVNENQKLEISAGATGAENASITVDGVLYSVPLTAGTAAHNAIEIETYFKPILESIFVDAINGEVIFQSNVASVHGIYSFSSATAIATFTQMMIGAPLTFDFTPLSQFNQLTPDQFLPEKINDYKVVIDGNLQFYIKDVETLEFSLVHTIIAMSDIDEPIFSNKMVLGGWAVQNLSGAPSVALYGTKCGTFIQGKDVVNGALKSYGNNLGGYVGSVDETIGALKVRSSFNNLLNRIKIYPSSLSVATDSNKPMIFDLILNPVFLDDMLFNYIDEDNSFAEISVNKVAITGGQLVQSFSIPAAGGEFFVLKDIFPFLEAGDVLAGVCRMGSASAATVSSTISWIEEIE